MRYTSASRIFALAGALAVGAMALPEQLAHAEPGGAELNSLRPVDAQTYATYSTYGAGAWQFVTPDGIRCRLFTTSRWQGPPSATCWGALPGVTNGTNYAFAKAFTNMTDIAPKSGLGTADLNDFETYRSYTHRSGSEVDRVDPASYHLLAAGQKIAVGDGTVVSCGLVDAHIVVCRVGSVDAAGWEAGFVLSPKGNRTF